MIHIITIHNFHNFGSVFQAFALYRFLEDHGYKVDIIDYNPVYYKRGRNSIKTLLGKLSNLKAHIIRERRFLDFVQKYDRVSESDFSTLKELEECYKDENSVFITGGDQLWNDYHPCGNDSAYKLSFVSTGKKIAYGTSMGRNDYNDSELAELSKSLSGYACIMLREQSTVPLLKRYLKTQIEHVIDPVGLIDIEIFKNMTIKPTINEPYAVMYLADSSPVLDEAIKILSEDLSLKIVHICGFRKKCYCDVFEKALGPEEILGYILNAQFVLSASYHATLFSILFKKNFATILPGEKINTRIEDLLSYVCLNDRLVYDSESLQCLKKSIDYSQATKRLEELRQYSRQLLLSTIDDLGANA